MGGGGGIIDTITSPISTVLMPGISGPAQLLTGRGPIGSITGGLLGGGQVSTMPFMDPGMRPEMAPFQSQLNPDGTIKDVYKTQDTYDPRAINQIRQDALRTPGQLSRWGQMAQSNAANQIAKQQGGQLATAQSNLAMQGGLRTGARERLQSQNMQSGLMAKQNAYNQIAMQDEQNRLGQLNNLAGQELGLANYQTGVQNTNIGRATADIGQNRLYEMNKYNEAMRAWAAANTANAMPQTQDRGLIGNLLGGLL